MNQPKVYNYVGASEIRESVSNAPSGTAIYSITDLISWIGTIANNKNQGNLIIATFVIDLDGTLRLADRHSEHVACAGGEPVLSAGEIFIDRTKNGLAVTDISNQSTGYCPEIESWLHVKRAIDKIPIGCPANFTIEFIFRSCCHCSQINIVKDNIFICQVCDSILPSEWNFQSIDLNINL